jgi:exosortase/archaeosortase family protein
MEINKKTYLFLLYFIVLYSFLSIILLKTIGEPLIVFLEMIIRSIFKDLINYEAFIFVPICSGVISISIYLSIVFSWKYAFKKKVRYMVVVGSVLFLWLANLLRLVMVLFSEKVGLTFAKTMHVTSWFLIGAIILYLSLNSFKK